MLVHLNLLKFEGIKILNIREFFNPNLIIPKCNFINYYCLKSFKFWFYWVHYIKLDLMHNFFFNYVFGTNIILYFQNIYMKDFLKFKQFSDKALVLNVCFYLNLRLFIFILKILKKNGCIKFFLTFFLKTHFGWSLWF